jgi:hypothetical protein
MRIIISLCLISLLFVRASCKKDDDVQSDTTIYVPAYLKQMLPYTNGQTIRYTKGSGSPIQATLSITTDFSVKSNCPSCAPYSREEYKTYYFKVGNMPFITLGIDNRPIIFMSIMSPEHTFQIGGGFDFNTQSGIAQPACSGPRQACISSISLNGRTYQNVLEVSNGNPPVDQIQKAYYTVSQGLIGFVYGNGTTYSLE